MERFPEIARKTNRPYACLLLPYRDSIQICIPYRSNIRHGNAYHFKTSIRSQIHHSGLDFSKVVLTTNLGDISEETATVDQDEYRETISQIERIKAEVTAYIDDYVRVRSGDLSLHPREYARRYAFSTLPYFDNLLINLQ